MKFLKDFIIAFLIGVAVFILLTIVQYMNDFKFNSSTQVLQYFAINQLYAISLYFVNAYYFRSLLKWTPKETFKLKNLLLGASGGIVLTLASLLIIDWIISVLFFGEDFLKFIARQEIQDYYIPFMISVFITSIFYILYYNKNKQDLKVTEQKIIAGTASAKFDALRSQLDPHFLFNSLNVLTSLIEENPALASKFTISLSKVYRYVLEQKNKVLVSLEEEMKFAEVYMALMSIRFEDSIEFTRPDKLINPDAKVVPLSLQLLLENAVKHNQVVPGRKLRISIIEKDNYLVVINNLQLKQILNKGTGVGLQNIRDRYVLVTKQAVLIEETKNEFKVQIPLLDPNTEIRINQEAYTKAKSYERAKAKVYTLVGFYLNLILFIFTAFILIYLSYNSQTDFSLFILPTCVWGLGILIHASRIFNWNLFTPKKWQERKIKEYMNKDKDL